MPTVREESGLAMSSRNAYLSQEERDKASIIFHALREAKKAFKEGHTKCGKNNPDSEDNDREPLRTDGLCCRSRNHDLEPVEKIEDKEVLVAVAVRFGRVKVSLIMWF